MTLLNTLLTGLGGGANNGNANGANNGNANGANNGNANGANNTNGNGGGSNTTSDASSGGATTSSNSTAATSYVAASAATQPTSNLSTATAPAKTSLAPDYYDSSAYERGRAFIAEMGLDPESAKPTVWSPEDFFVDDNSLTRVRARAEDPIGEFQKFSPIHSIFKIEGDGAEVLLKAVGPQPTPTEKKELTEEAVGRTRQIEANVAEIQRQAVQTADSAAKARVVTI